MPEERERIVDEEYKTNKQIKQLALQVIKKHHPTQSDRKFTGLVVTCDVKLFLYPPDKILEERTHLSCSSRQTPACDFTGR